MRIPTLALLAAAALAPAAVAQGSLSTQGFGYPAGQISARAGGMGGSIAELDPLSPENPASLTSWGRTGVYVEYGPEFRSVTANGRTDDLTIVRFPLIAVGVRLGERWTAGASVSTLLDRSWAAVLREPVNDGEDTTTVAFRSTGAINDVRIGLGYQLRPQLRLGLAGHVYPGSNRLRVSRFSTDSGQLNFFEQTDISYSGQAVSAGLEWHPSRVLAVGASATVGLDMEAFRGDSAIASANAPNSYGVSVQYTGFAGTVLAARAQRAEWSRLAALARPDGSTRAFDTWDYGVGGQFTGPRVLGVPLLLRAGFRARDLPFAAAGERVSERVITSGVGIPLVPGRTSIDVAIARATRDAGLPVDESAWLLNVGIVVRP